MIRRNSPRPKLTSEVSYRNSATRPTSTAQAQKRRRSVVLLVMTTALVAAAVASSVWLGHKAIQIRASLNASLQLLPTLQEQLLSRDASSAEQTVAELRQHTAEARAAGTDPVWKAASVLPFIGPNFSAVTEVSVSASDVVDLAVTPLVNEFGSFQWDALTPVEGRIELNELEQASPTLAAAARTVQLSQERLASIDERKLLPKVALPLAEANQALLKASTQLNSAAVVAETLPSMLGISGSRNYLMLIQNSAEIRATGGIPGAVAVINATDGQLQLSAQGSATEMGEFVPPIIIDHEQVSIFSSRMGRFMQSTNLTPDFPTAAQTGASMWEERNSGMAIDGVVALDPVALSHILEATGPVDLAFDDPAASEILRSSGLPISLSADNVVQTLLSDVYAAIEEPKLQDAYFAAVASQVFDALSTGTGGSEGLIDSLITSANEGRLYVWSAHPEEQALLSMTDISGSVAGPGTGGASFGAYFNDGTGAKMDYYVRRTVQLHRSCTPEGFLTYTLTATLTNTAPADAAVSLPEYVTGGGAFGVPPGSVQTNFVGYGPDRSRLQTARINGDSVPLGSYRHGNRPVGILTTSLTAGETVTVEMDFTNVVQTSEPRLDVTPTIQPLSDVILPLSEDPSCEP